MVNIPLICRGAKLLVIGFQADMQEFCSNINVMRHRWFHCHRVQIVVDVLAIDCSILWSSTFVATVFGVMQRSCQKVFESIMICAIAMLLVCATTCEIYIFVVNFVNN